MKTKKVFIDTNVWLRFLVADQKEKYQACKRLIALNEEGKLRVYTSTVVLLEVIYTLTSFYRISKKEMVKDIKTILSSRNLTLVEKTDFRKALSCFSKHNIKLADCLIATQLPKQTILCTYDKDFEKLKTIVNQTPDQIIKKL